MFKTILNAVVSVGVAFTALPATAAVAQVQKTGSFLNLDLAIEAAQEAVRVCAARGWPVSAAVVDTAGNVKLQAKGDHSTIHTKDTSFRKAYTVATMGAIFDFDRLGVWVDKLKSNPNATALASIPGIILLPGAVAVKIRGEIVAAIGVGGAPGGDKDEECALAGLDKIKSRLPQ
ncbi:MAG: heme-binding protein [Rhodospirillales bacterium]|nr:heme-binding protein [Rhodospirillales bacterium]